MTETAADRAVVEQAKGAIMLRYGVSSCESLAAIARWAHQAHVTVPDMAHALVKGICQGRVTPENRATVRWLEQRLRADIGEVPRATVTMSLRPSTAVAARTPTQAPPPPATAADTAAAARQWRYASAVHAARAVGSP